MNRTRLPILVALCVALAGGPVVLAESQGTPDLHRAYFLEHQTKDFAAARALYEKARSAASDDETRRIAVNGANRCRDAIAAQDFARLMPPDSIAYVEITRPGQIFEKLAGMVGLTTPDMQAILAQRPTVESNSQAHIPSQIAISPAIFEALAEFGGAAVAITDFDPEEKRPPAGVIVIHHGDAKLCRGLIETAFQFAPTTAKIHDMATFVSQVPEIGRITGVLTESLLIVGTTRDLTAGVVERLLSNGKGSLGERADLSEIAEQRKGATIFAYCDLQAIIKLATAHMDEDDRGEMKTVDALVDLDSLKWAAFSFGIHEGAMNLQATMRLADDHRNIVYNLTRLPPMSQQCLAKVPGEAAGFFGLGLNPTITLAAADSAKPRQGQQAITGFDLGREFFGNIREVCGFVLPGKGARSEMPNGGLVFAVNDVAKSRALWDQFLSIPGMVGGDSPIKPRPVQIGSVEAMSYFIPEFGKVYLAQLDGCLAVTAARSAMKACVQAHTKGQSILKDPLMTKVIEKMPRDTSIMAAAHVGRMVKVAGAADPGMSMFAQPASELCSQTVASLALGQAPNQLSLRMSISGLPNVNDALAKYGPMINAFIPKAAPQKEPKDDDELAQVQDKKKAIRQ